MTTLHIEIPDDRAAALRAKAQAQGLTLEDYFRHLAEREASGTSVAAAASDVPSSNDERAWLDAPRSPQEAAERIREIRKYTKPDPEGWTVKDYRRA
jgi:hypothetical protein